MKPADTFDVAVLSYGPVGATLANLLVQQGLTVAVLERESGVYHLARAGHFDAEIMRVFQSIGVAEEVEAETELTDALRFLDADGALLMEWKRGGGILGDVTLEEITAEGHSAHRTEAGEFGMELGASMLVALLTSALKPLFDKYVEKLTAKLVDKAAEKTMDVVKRAFLGDLRGDRANLTFEEIKSRLEAKQKSLGISKKELDRILEALKKQQEKR